MGAFDLSMAAGGMADSFEKLLARRDLQRERDRDYQIRMAELAMRQEEAKRAVESEAINRAMQRRTITLDNIKRLEGTPVSQIPFEQREGPDGGSPIVSVTDDDTPERVNRFKPMDVPGIPQLNVPGVQLRPQTMEEGNAAARQAALIKQESEGFNLGPGQQHWVGGKMTAENTNADPSDLPALQREFEYAKSQGFKGGFMDYIVAKKEKPSGASGVDAASFREARQLANDWRKNNKDTYDMRGALSAMQSGYDAIASNSINGVMNPGSQAILSRFQKMLDPGSVVRESEYARSPEGVSLLNRFQGIIDRVSKGGAGVPVSDLKSFVDVANKIMEGQNRMMRGEYERLQRFAKYAQVPEDLIFTAEDTAAHDALLAPQAPAGAKKPADPLSAALSDYRARQTRRYTGVKPPQGKK